MWTLRSVFQSNNLINCILVILPLFFRTFFHHFVFCFYYLAFSRFLFALFDLNIKSEEENEDRTTKTTTTTKSRTDFFPPNSQDKMYAEREEKTQKEMKMKNRKMKTIEHKQRKIFVNEFQFLWFVCSLNAMCIKHKLKTQPKKFFLFVVVFI